MFCSIYKWFISSALDSRKPIPSFLKRHIQRCDFCREFAELHESLMQSGVEDLPCISDEKKSALAKNIISALDRDQEPAKPLTQRPALVPVFVSSFVLLAVVAGIYFLTSQRPNPTHLFNSLSSIDNTISSFEERLVQVNSPLNAEYEDLKETMISTTEFFASYLDVKIGQGTERIQ